MTNHTPITNHTGTATRREVERPGRRGARRARVLLAASLVAIGGTAGCGGSALESADPGPSTAITVTEPSGGGQDAPPTTPSAQPVGADVARPAGDVSVLDAPGGTEVRTLTAETDFGSQRALLITDAQPGWLQVLVPGRPNGLTGWIAEEGVEVRNVPMGIRVDLTARTLSLNGPDGTMLETPVAIGSPEAPTPTGTFSITDKLETGDDNSAYGPFALGLSGRSEVLTEFAGGDGQVGIHGTNAPDSIGQDVSHGCIRVPNEVIAGLNELVPLGTPVEIV